MRWPLTGDAAVESTLGTFTLAGRDAVRTSTWRPTRGRRCSMARPEAQFTATGSARPRAGGDRSASTAPPWAAGCRARAACRGSATSGGARGSRRRTSTSRRCGPTCRAASAPWRPSRDAASTPTSPWTARLASLSGTVRGRALTGRGEVAHRNGNYDLRGVRIANGGSHVDIDGRWGSTVDLRWNADVRSLALLHPDLSGELVSSGRARGNATRPQLDGRCPRPAAALRQYRSSHSLQGEVDLDLTDAARITRRPARHVGRPRLRRCWTRHGSSCRAAPESTSCRSTSRRPGDDTRRLPGFDARLAARGEFEVGTRRWHGLLEEATLAYPDGRATLLQPAAIEVGPDAVACRADLPADR